MKKPNLKSTVLIVSLMAGIMFTSRGWADDTAQLREQVQALQNRVDQLENQLTNKQQAAPQAFPSANVNYEQWEDPFAQMMLMQDQMDRNMSQAFADSGMVFAPKMDMKKTDKKYIITMDIPGMDKDKINVEIKDGILTVSGERNSETTQDNKSNQYYRRERSFGSFMQAIPLPEDAKRDHVGADYKNGVLTVIVDRQKKEEKKPGAQKITVM